MDNKQKISCKVYRGQNGMIIILMMLFTKFTFEAGRVSLLRHDTSYITILEDTVTIRDSNMTITGLSGVYNEINKKLFLYGDIRAFNSKSEVKSDSLIVHQNSGIMLFMSEVSAFKGRDTLMGDCIYMHKDTIIASGNVHGRIASKDVKFRADSLSTVDSTSKLIGNASAFIGKDSGAIVIKADSMYIPPDSLIAFSHVVVKDKKFQSEGNELLYVNADSTGILIGPTLTKWDSGKAFSDTLFFKMKRKSINNVMLVGNVKIENTRTSSNVTIFPDTALLYIQDSRIKRLVCINGSGVIQSNE